MMILIKVITIKNSAWLFYTIWKINGLPHFTQILWPKFSSKGSFLTFLKKGLYCTDFLSTEKFYKILNHLTPHWSLGSGFQTHNQTKTRMKLKLGRPQTQIWVSWILVCVWGFYVLCSKKNLLGNIHSHPKKFGSGFGYAPKTHTQKTQILWQKFSKKNNKKPKKFGFYSTLTQILFWVFWVWVLGRIKFFRLLDMGFGCIPKPKPTFWVWIYAWKWNTL